VSARSPGDSAISDAGHSEGLPSDLIWPQINVWPEINADLRG
jgi:hypothetical protein